MTKEDAAYAAWCAKPSDQAREMFDAAYNAGWTDCYEELTASPITKRSVCERCGLRRKVTALLVRLFVCKECLP